MNTLLVFFALPLATIIISIALQKILKCLPLVAAIVFAIFLIVTFIINDLNFLIATIVYTIISFLTALLVCVICRFINNENDNNSNNSCGCGCDSGNNANNTNNTALDTQNPLVVSSSYNGLNEENVLNNNCNSAYNNYNGAYNCNTISSNGTTARVNVIPNKAAR